MLDQITPLILTHNELPNIERSLARLAWAKRIVVIDSFSTDGTLDILRRDPRIAVFTHRFIDFAGQCNFGLAHIETEWVLSLDADYVLSDALIGELRRLVPAGSVAGYRAGFVYCVHGRPLRGTLYPPRTVLHRRDRAAYLQEGHAHRVRLDGAVLPLRSIIYHDDRKTLSRWLAAQQRYAGQEAGYLLAGASGSGRRGGRQPDRADRLRLLGWPAPIAVLFYVLLVKGCLLDGWPGWYYALQRLFAETLLALEILDRRHRQDRGSADAATNACGVGDDNTGRRDAAPAQTVVRARGR